METMQNRRTLMRARDCSRGACRVSHLAGSHRLRWAQSRAGHSKLGAQGMPHELSAQQAAAAQHVDLPQQAKRCRAVM